MSKSKLEARLAVLENLLCDVPCGMKPSPRLLSAIAEVKKLLGVA